VPVPPYRPCASVITTYYLFEGLLHFGEAEVPGVKSLLNVQLDIEHFSRAPQSAGFKEILSP